MSRCGCRDWTPAQHIHNNSFISSIGFVLLHDVFCYLIDDSFRKLNSVGIAREWGMHSIQRFNMFKSRLPMGPVRATHLWSIFVHLHNLVARCEGNNHVQNTFYIAPDDGEVFSCGPTCWCTRRQRAQV